MTPEDPGGLDVKTGDMVRVLNSHYPEIQALYLFGSYGTEAEWPERL